MEFVERLLQLAVEKKASDLHLSVGAPPTLRIDGLLQSLEWQILRPEDTHAAVKYLMTSEQYLSFAESGELDFSFGLPGVARFRINAFQQRNCVSVALRLIPTDIPSWQSLGLDQTVLSMAMKPQGLLLVTGPTGSGKSTTLASLIDYINQSTKKHVITLEDPIEYLHRHGSCLIDQREVGSDTNSFATGLRAALRQDPDVILVGEMRDLETTQIALTAAETGHLVMASLHTTDAPQTIDRIVDVFPPAQQQQVRVQLASVLIGVLSQRLLPRWDNRGRVAITELLVNNAAVANLIRSEKVHQIKGVIQTSRHLGMRTMSQSARIAMAEGLISQEAAREWGLTEETDG